MATQLWRSSSYADPRSAAIEYSHAYVNHRSISFARRRDRDLPEFLQLDRPGTLHYAISIIRGSAPRLLTPLFDCRKERTGSLHSHLGSVLFMLGC